MPKESNIRRDQDELYRLVTENNMLTRKISTETSKRKRYKKIANIWSKPSKSREQINKIEEFARNITYWKIKRRKNDTKNISTMKPKTTNSTK